MLDQFFSLKNKEPQLKIGGNTHIQSQLHSLEIEKDILTKTISRLYDDESGLSKIQRDKLLLRYQHQLGVIIARIEKLETVSKHPDLGPLGEGLITLMDQKLSQLDQRLYELTSKIQVSENEKTELVTKETNTNEKSKSTINTIPQNSNIPKVNTSTIEQLDIPKISNKESEKKFEITTLTSAPKLDSFKQTKYDEMLSQLNSDVITPPKRTEIDKQQELQIIPKQVESQISNPTDEEKPKQKIQFPQEPEIDDDDDDDDDIKEIMAKVSKTLAKIEQAEVD